jgi:hypothetical protein
MRKLLFNYSFYSHPKIGKFQGVKTGGLCAALQATQVDPRPGNAPHPHSPPTACRCVHRSVRALPSTECAYRGPAVIRTALMSGILSDEVRPPLALPSYKSPLAVPPRARTLLSPMHSRSQVTPLAPFPYTTRAPRAACVPVAQLSLPEQRLQ